MCGGDALGLSRNIREGIIGHFAPRHRHSDPELFLFRKLSRIASHERTDCPVIGIGRTASLQISDDLRARFYARFFFDGARETFRCRPFSARCAQSRHLLAFELRLLHADRTFGDGDDASLRRFSRKAMTAFSS